MTPIFNTYQEYIDNSTHPYIKSEKQFKKEIEEKKNEQIPTKIFNSIFHGVDYILPYRLKGTGIIMKVSIMLAVSNFNYQSKFVKCTTLVGVVGTAVFFYPNLLLPFHFPSSVDSSFFINTKN